MTEVEATGILDRSPPQAIKDIWSWTAPKYRRRSIALLIVNILLFAGLGCFAYWLRTGIALAPGVEHYWQLLAQTFSFSPKGEATLADFVLFPIRLDQVPMHGVVVGLLLAAMVSIPILISILYRFGCCLPFLLVVAFLAVMPWLALTLTGACVLASVKPFRFNFRYASALLGLGLVLVYFYGASRQVSMPLDIVKPGERIKFMAPFVLATIASCVIMGGVLFVSKLVNYRPGVVAPLLLVCFTVPVGLFEGYVGRDELYYRLLEDRFQKKFADRDVSEWFERVVHRAWLARKEPRPAFDAIRDNVELRLMLELESRAESTWRTAFAEDRDLLIQDCDRFLRFFPDSRYAANVLYIKGTSLDMRVDLAAFRDKKEIRFYDNFPAERSHRTWQRVLANAVDSEAAAVGRYKLATSAARDGKIDEATAILEALIAQYDPAQTTPKPPKSTASATSVLQRKSPEAGLRIQVAQTVFEAKRFLSLLRENWNDPRYGNRPFCGSRPREPLKPGLLRFDPRHPQYSSNLLRLKRIYPACSLSDNVSLLAALRSSGEERTALLERCLADYPSSDARPETLFRLAAAYQETDDPARAKELLETLLDDHPQSLWASPAKDRLRAIGPVKTEVLK